MCLSFLASDVLFCTFQDSHWLGEQLNFCITTINICERKGIEFETLDNTSFKCKWTFITEMPTTNLDFRKYDHDHLQRKCKGGQTGWNLMPPWMELLWSGQTSWSKYASVKVQKPVEWPVHVWNYFHIRYYPILSYMGECEIPYKNREVEEQTF